MFHDLRSHVLRSAEWGFSQLVFFKDSSKAEISNLDNPLVQKEIFRLKVSMNNILLVQPFESVKHLKEVLVRLNLRDTVEFCFPDFFLKVAAVAKLCHEVLVSASVRKRVECL